MELHFDRSPYQRFLGIELIRAEEGLVEIRLPFKDDFLRLDGSDWLHGGIVSALVDIAGAYAVVSSEGEGAGATVDLRIDWLQPARRGDLLATGTLLRAGGRICRADVEVRDEAGTVVAVGRGTFTGARS